MVTPPPVAPPNRSGFAVGKSEPPEAYPNETLETGIITTPSPVVMGLPTMVLTSTRERRLLSADSVNPLMGCC
jgi:hypothetical protein